MADSRACENLLKKGRNKNKKKKKEKRKQKEKKKGGEELLARYCDPNCAKASPPPRFLSCGGIRVGGGWERG